jgi:SAM-dependent methyltransferase
MSPQAATASLMRVSPCDICRSSEARLRFTAMDRLGLATEPFLITECVGCRVWRTLPEMSDRETAQFYPEEYWGRKPEAAWIRASQSGKLAFWRQCKAPGGRILDVGCGAGFFLCALPDERWEKFGVETGPGAVAMARRLLEGRTIVQGTLAEAALSTAFFDVVTFWSSLEHTSEPRRNLLEARRILKPGGTVIVQAPNASSYQAKRFKGDWFALDAPRHRYHFSIDSLTRLLAETGFAIYRTSFQSREHNAHALRQSLKRRLWPHSVAHRAAFVLSTPLIRPLDYLLSAAGKGATLTVAARAV